MRRFSQVCVCIWGGGGHGEVGLGSQPSLQEAGSWGLGEELTETQGPHCLLYWPWGTLHKETAPSLLAPTSWALGWVGGGTGQVQVWPCWGGIPKNPVAGIGGGQTWSWPSSSSTQTGVGVLSSSCNHFYLILLRVVRGRIYLLSDDALQLWSVYLRRDCILKESITQY